MNLRNEINEIISIIINIASDHSNLSDFFVENYPFNFHMCCSAPSELDKNVHYFFFQKRLDNNN